MKRARSDSSYQLTTEAVPYTNEVLAMGSDGQYHVFGGALAFVLAAKRLTARYQMFLSGDPDWEDYHPEFTVDINSETEKFIVQSIPAQASVFVNE